MKTAQALVAAILFLGSASCTSKRGIEERTETIRRTVDTLVTLPAQEVAFSVARKDIGQWTTVTLESGETAEAKVTKADDGLQVAVRLPEQEIRVEVEEVWAIEERVKTPPPPKRSRLAAVIDSLVRLGSVALVGFGLWLFWMLFRDRRRTARIWPLLLLPSLGLAQTFMIDPSCPHYVIEQGNTTIDYCGEITGLPVDYPENPCGQIDMYVMVQFTTEGGWYPVEIVSDVNYVAWPNTPTNQLDMWILDGCGGELIATSHNGACAVGPYCGENSAAVAYTAGFCLDAGTYVAVIGYMNHTDLPFGAYLAQEGCVSYTFGHPVFLDLPSLEAEERPEDTPAPVVRPSRPYTYHPHAGIYRRTSDGQCWDILGRRISCPTQ